MAKLEQSMVAGKHFWRDRYSQFVPPWLSFIIVPFFNHCYHFAMEFCYFLFRILVVFLHIRFLGRNTLNDFCDPGEIDITHVKPSQTWGLFIIIKPQDCLLSEGSSFVSWTFLYQTQDNVTKYIYININTCDFISIIFIKSLICDRVSSGWSGYDMITCARAAMIDSRITDHSDWSCTNCLCLWAAWGAIMHCCLPDSCSN